MTYSMLHLHHTLSTAENHLAQWSKIGLASEKLLSVAFVFTLMLKLNLRYCIQFDPEYV